MIKRQSKAVRIGWKDGKALYDRCELWIHYTTDQHGGHKFVVYATDGTGYAGVGQCIFQLDSWKGWQSLDSVTGVDRVVSGKEGESNKGLGGLGRHKLTGTLRRWLHLPVYGLAIGNFDSLSEAFKAGGMDGRLLAEVDKEWVLLSFGSADSSCDVYRLFYGDTVRKTWMIPRDWSYGKDVAQVERVKTAFAEMHAYLDQLGLAYLLNRVQFK